MKRELSLSHLISAALLFSAGMLNKAKQAPVKKKGKRSITPKLHQSLCWLTRCWLLSRHEEEEAALPPVDLQSFVLNLICFKKDSNELKWSVNRLLFSCCLHQTEKKSSCVFFCFSFYLLPCRGGGRTLGGSVVLRPGRKWEGVAARASAPCEHLNFKHILIYRYSILVKAFFEVLMLEVFCIPACVYIWFIVKWNLSLMPAVSCRAHLYSFISVTISFKPFWAAHCAKIPPNVSSASQLLAWGVRSPSLLIPSFQDDKKMFCQI